MNSEISFPTESDFEFLRSDKSNLFEIDEHGNKKWDSGKINKFWALLYEIHKDGNDFLFVDYQFPPIIGDGFLCFKTREIDTPVVFRNCTFWGRFEMNDLVFNESVSFRDSRFFNKTEFNNVTFKDKVWFSFTSFDNNSYFNEVVFDSKCYFSKATFNDVYFTEIEFNDKTYFDRSTIIKASFRDVNFGACIFDRINMFDKGVNHYTNSPEVNFISIDFTSSTKFLQYDFTNTNFRNCNLTQINLRSCKFNKSGNRIIFHKEHLNLKGNEENYRDFKRNFYEKKNWETSGLFYVSEMELRKNRLLKEGKYFEWFIYWFYGFFGGYTQDFKRPLFSFLFFSFLFFPTIYFFLETSFLLEEKVKDNILDSLQKSVSNSLPLIKTKLEYKNWWLKSFQIVFTGILLTFTVLGLRKRFKQ